MLPGEHHGVGVEETGFGDAVGEVGGEPAQHVGGVASIGVEVAHRPEPPTGGICSVQHGASGVTWAVPIQTPGGGSTTADQRLASRVRAGATSAEKETCTSENPFTYTSARWSSSRAAR